jgi:hypothetical protein
MRRLIAIAGAIALAAAVAAPAAATPADDHKDVVCHATSSLVNPYVVIVVDTASAKGQKNLEAHMEHQENSNKKHGHADLIFSWDEWVANDRTCEEPAPEPEL